MGDIEDQNDEICVLESIYTREELQIERNEEGKISGKFFAFVTVPRNFSITYKLLESESSNEVEIPSDKFNVLFLPPIILSFKLPSNYPSEAMPEYRVSCTWLKISSLKRLSEKLLSLWAENKGMVILYIWTQFLKDDSLSFLGIEDSLDITGFYAYELKKFHKVPVCSNGCSPSKAPPLRGRRKREREKSFSEDRLSRYNFSIIPIPNMHLHQFLKAYSEDRGKTEFFRSVYSCEICFTEKLGAKCIKFVPCDHVYCKDCLKSFYLVRIKDGSIHSMPCPYDKCSSEALQSQLISKGNKAIEVIPMTRVLNNFFISSPTNA